MEDLQTIGVVGAGPLGAAVAQICVQSGLEVVLVDDTEEQLGWAEERVLKGLHRAEQPAAFSLMRKATRLDKLDSCELVIECATEAPEHKMDLLRRIDVRLRRESVLAVHTTAIPVSVVSRSVENPDRVVGLHFFQPAHIEKFVEVVRYEHASKATVERAVDFVAKLGKTPVKCKDCPGFVANRLSRPFMLTAQRLVEMGRATPDKVDAALRSLGGFRAGPFEIADFFGLDEDLAVSEIVFQLMDDAQRLEPTEIERALVAAGHLGRKSGEGFYLHGDFPSGTANPRLAEMVAVYGKQPLAPEGILSAVLDGIFAEAHAIVDEGVCGPEDVDRAALLGLHWPHGPFEWEKERSG